MTTIHRRVLIGAALAAALAAGAARAESAATGSPEIAAARFLPSRVDPPSGPAAAVAPADTSVPTIRRLEPEDAVTGAEPDPESFDRAGLEAWWRHFQETSRNPD